MTAIIIKSVTSLLILIIVPTALRYLIQKTHHKTSTKKIEEEQKLQKVKIIRWALWMRIVMWVGIFFLLLMLLPTAIIFSPSDELLPSLILCVILVLPWLIIATCWTLWKIEVHKEYFVYRNYFGRKRTYYYKDITDGVNKQVTKWVLYNNGKKIVSLSIVVTDYTPLKHALYKFQERERRRKRIEAKSQE